MLKGRSNYLCIHRFKQSLELGSIEQVSPSKAQEIEIWRHRTISGDLTEILDFESLIDLEPLVSSTAEIVLEPTAASIVSAIFPRQERLLLNQIS